MVTEITYSLRLKKETNMKENKIFKLVMSVILASMMLAAFFVPLQTVQAKSELVGFTFTNNSDRLASLR